MSMLYWLTKVKEVSRITANPLKLSYVCNYGKMGQKEIITHTKFLHKEIPIRLSQRIEDLHQLPHDLSKNKSMQEIYELYMNSFQKLHSYKTPEYWNWNDCLDYVEEVSKLKDEHIDIEFRISNAIKDYKNEIGYKNGYFDKNINDIDKILTNFYYSRIGIRFLLSQHIEILKQLDKGKEVNGIIDNKCTPYGIVNDAVSNVESKNDLQPFLEKLPDYINIVPKIESPNAVLNIKEICGALKTEKKIVMLDHDDLFSSIIRNNEDKNSFQEYIKKLISFCDEENISLLRTVGVMFSDDEKRTTQYEK